MAGAFALGGALGAPAIGRLVDRFGQPRVLVPVAVGHAAGLGALVALGPAGRAARPSSSLTALATGVCIPPISAVLRRCCRAWSEATRSW